jgi:putative acetyltransferase
LKNALVIRREGSGDAAGIFEVHRSCFPTEGEAKLVDMLRDAARLAVSIVAEVDGKIVGHVALSPVTVGSGEAGLGLGPLAVGEAWRRQGIGERLVRSGLDGRRAANCGWVVVLGDPAYYGRFGFQPAKVFGLSDEYRGGDAFQALELVEGSLPHGAGLVRYAAEFSLLE